MKGNRRYFINSLMSYLFKKFFKVIISMLLVLTLVFPTYSSLSASDGSSFVTREEYENAVMNFESRLMNFEAGVNSKIDSQISSYLDRNGIWSGVDQGIEDKYLGSTGIKTTVAGSGKYGNYWHVTNTGAWKKYISNTNERCLVEAYRTDGNIELIPKMSKNGLMLLGVYGNMQTNSDRFGIHVMMDNTANSDLITVSADSIVLNYMEKVSFYQKTSGVAPDKLLNSIILTYNCPVPGVASMTNYPLKYLKFFVTKDSQLYILFDSAVYCNAAVGGDRSALPYIGHQWYVKEAVIY